MYNIQNPFIKHPKEVGMSYMEHARFALYLARKTFTIAIASVVHAIFPFLFVTYTSSQLNRLNNLLKERVQSTKKNQKRALIE